MAARTASAGSEMEKLRRTINRTSDPELRARLTKEYNERIYSSGMALRPSSHEEEHWNDAPADEPGQAGGPHPNELRQIEQSAARVAERRSGARGISGRQGSQAAMPEDEQSAWGRLVRRRLEAARRLGEESEAAGHVPAREGARQAAEREMLRQHMDLVASFGRRFPAPRGFWASRTGFMEAKRRYGEFRERSGRRPSAVEFKDELGLNGFYETCKALGSAYSIEGIILMLERDKQGK